MSAIPLIEASPPLGRRGSRVGALLRVPLFAKLVGANLAIVLAVASVAAWRHVSEGHASSGLILLVTVLLGGLLVNTVLVVLALRPLREVELVVERAAGGDLDAEVVPSSLYDQQLTRVGAAVNALVSGVRGDRQRMRQLAIQVIRAQDEERSRIARELHDSTAQTLAALQLQLSAATRDLEAGMLTEEDARTRMGALRDMAGTALEEVRLLSHTVYPRILDDLGLPAALEWLARRAREQEQVDLRVELRGDPAVRLQPPQAGALYRVAQEGLRNALRHSGATEVVLRLTVAERLATLEVIDDGRGFDPVLAERRRPGMGLFSMRERASLVGGAFTIRSKTGGGTIVRATVPTETDNHER